MGIFKVHLPPHPYFKAVSSAHFSLAFLFAASPSFLQAPSPSTLCDFLQNLLATILPLCTTTHTTPSDNAASSPHPRPNTSNLPSPLSQTPTSVFSHPPSLSVILLHLLLPFLIRLRFSFEMQKVFAPEALDFFTCFAFFCRSHLY